ncbi:type II secretion system protein [Sulfuriroseicoccus oceanibius]|uniref:Type II secretion system protein n=1 Tax=Sulfuriroseicoccus oceanibius TaxID=2707525 RepID=A0A6B3LBG5_9BACT|nr:type II secretion system protein [Sulfuriroseicoccus oceanibius]QQL44480.1 type II secretion system protein [Sulfuriroseicoccus oceanibius]
MKKNTLRKNKGMTLLELTIVILVLLTLIGVLFFGAQAYKEGSDRTACVLNIRNVQLAMRSYVNLNGIPQDTAMSQGDFIGTGKFLEALPECPGGGTYTLDLGTEVPAAGDVVTTCSLNASKNHDPQWDGSGLDASKTGDW